MGWHLCGSAIVSLVRVDDAKSVRGCGCGADFRYGLCPDRCASCRGHGASGFLGCAGYSVDRGNPGILAVKVDALSRPAVEQTRRLWFGIHIGEFWFGSEPGGFAARDAAKAEQLTRTLDFPSELSVWEKGVELITRIRRVAGILTDNLRFGPDLGRSG